MTQERPTPEQVTRALRTWTPEESAAAWSELPDPARRDLATETADRHPDGAVRLGRWLLDSGDGGAALTYRSTGRGAVLEWRLELEPGSGPDGWRVRDLHLRRHRPRRP